MTTAVTECARNSGLCIDFVFALVLLRVKISLMRHFTKSTMYVVLI